MRSIDGGLTWDAMLNETEYQEDVKSGGLTWLVMYNKIYQVDVAGDGLMSYVQRNGTEYLAGVHLIVAVGLPFDALVGTAGTLFPQFGWSNGTFSISGLLQRPLLIYILISTTVFLVQIIKRKSKNSGY